MPPLHEQVSPRVLAHSPADQLWFQESQGGLDPGLGQSLVSHSAGQSSPMTWCGEVDHAAGPCPPQTATETLCPTELREKNPEMAPLEVFQLLCVLEDGREFK